MSRRRTPSARTTTLDRPRLKGWREVPDDEEKMALTRPSQAQTQRPAPASELHTATPVGRLLTAEQTESVRAVMRLFLKEDLARGVPADHRLRCQACGMTKWAAGFVRYGRAALCNDCAAELELSLLRGRCRSVADFLAARQECGAG